MNLKDINEKTRDINSTISHSIFLKNGVNTNSLFNENNTLLMQAIKEYSSARWDDHIKNACARINVLLFFGADMHTKINGNDVYDYATNSRLYNCIQGPELIKHAHARRVNRLAQYLTRCTYLPKDVTLEIAQHHYGKLSDEDRKN